MNGESIIQSFLDTGVVSESDLLYALHKTGKVDVVKYIGEIVENYKLSVGSISTEEAIEKLREASTYFATMADILEDIQGDEVEEATESTQVISVIGGNN